MEIPKRISHKDLSKFQQHTHITKVLDSIIEQTEELFLIRNPQFKFNQNYTDELSKFRNTLFPTRERSDEYGEWFYFPWNGIVAHFLPENEWYELRTARNRDLISIEEQENFRNLTVGIAGLSVGSHIALTISMMGGSKNMVLADPDTVGPSNLNRIRATALDIGINKAIVTAQQIYQIDPYANIVVLENGVDESDISSFFEQLPLGLLIEETDKLSLKVKLREEARKRRVPVVMGTDNGDGAIIDVERYDLHNNLQIFNGLIGDITSESFEKFPPHELPKLATKIAGAELADPRMKDSILAVGKTLYSWPQLGDAATLCGVAIALIARRVACGQTIREGKFPINIDSVVDPEYDSVERKEAREAHHQKFIAQIGL